MYVVHLHNLYESTNCETSLICANKTDHDTLKVNLEHSKASTFYLFSKQVDRFEIKAKTILETEHSS